MYLILLYVVYVFQCVICLGAKATMQTQPCGHRVVCRRCFVKTIQVTPSLNMLFLDMSFQNTLFLDMSFLNTLLLDMSFLNTLFPEMSFLNTLFLDMSLLNKLFLDMSFLNTQFLNMAALNKN